MEHLSSPTIQGDCNRVSWNVTIIVFAFVLLPLAIVLAAGIRVVTKMSGIHEEIYEENLEEIMKKLLEKQADSSKASGKKGKK